MEEFKAELTQEIQKTINETLNKKQSTKSTFQLNTLSYVERVAFLPLSKSKSTLVLSPTDGSVSTQKIRKQLNTIPSKDLGLLQCEATKAGYYLRVIIYFG